MSASDRTVLLRYRYPDGRLQSSMPLHVVDDDGDTVVGWLAPGTEILYWAAADGTDPRGIPLDRRFLGDLGTARRTWTGEGVLRVIPLAEPWQAIHFRHADGSFANWYVNLEAPKRRDGDVLETVDWHLDLVIDPELRPAWKDEDEADAALGTPYLRRDDLEVARRAGEAIAADPAAWLDRIGDWRGYRPPGAWGPLALPAEELRRA